MAPPRHPLLAGAAILLPTAFLAPAAALAIGLGELQVHSALGEPLEVSIGVSVAPGEALAAECFALDRGPAGGVPAITRATFAVEPAASRARVRIRTIASVNEPAVMLRLQASCDGGGAILREYAVLLDPRPTIVPSPAPAAATPPVIAPAPAPAASPAAPAAPGLRSLSGDTLASIAQSIYPRHRQARAAYVDALRSANPSVAALGDGDPIPPDTVLQLPDQKAFARTLRPGRGPMPAERAPGAARPRSPAAKAEAQSAPPATAPRPPRARRDEPPRAPPAKRERRAAGGDFVLRLSAGDMDLSRSRQVDDRTRAQLRERLLLLDADDQVSALLQMRSSLKQLETRVAELQLKLSGPGSLSGAPAAARTPAETTVPGPAAASATTAPSPGAASATGPVVSPPLSGDASAISAPVPPSAPPAALPKPVAPESAKVPAPAKAAPTPASTPSPLTAFWPWALAALAALVLAAFAWRVLSRRRDFVRAAPVARPAPVRAADLAADEEPDEGQHDDDTALSPDAGHELTQRLPATDPQSLRRRYIEERFPEITAGTVRLDDADSVVKGARLFYEDGAMPRAVELLQFALEERPEAMKPWLALFEIFRLERLGGEFAALAARFREHHGASENWRKVQFIGRELDPADPLYQDAAFNSLETIGYPNARKSQEVAFDPLAENWLNAPMDFTGDALAADLRAGLMADAGMHDADLIPNPLPALKKVEVFTVA